MTKLPDVPFPTRKPVPVSPVEPREPLREADERKGSRGEPIKDISELLPSSALESIPVSEQSVPLTKLQSWLSEQLLQTLRLRYENFRPSNRKDWPGYRPFPGEKEPEDKPLSAPFCLTLFHTNEIVGAFAEVLSRQNYRIYTDVMVCSDCQKPLDEEETRIAASAAFNRRRMLARIFDAEERKAARNAKQVLEATELMLSVVERVCEVFNIWESEGSFPKELNDLNSAVHDAMFAGQAALDPQEEEH